MTDPIYKFKDWVIEKKLGAGNQSVILLAGREKLNHEIQRAAIRVMQHDENKSEQQKRMEAEQFAHEYEILSRLTSAYIAPVLDFGLEPVPWIATELIEGMDMQKFISRNGAASEDAWAKFAVHLLSGLSHAHSKKVIHQDIKPANIMITGDKAVWIDFSSATLIGQEDVGYAGGASTPAYSSPERLLSQGFSKASDIFSLGIVLLELASGNHPWDFRGIPNDPSRMRAGIAKFMKENPVNYNGLTHVQKSVIKRMLVIDSRERATAEDLLDVLGASHIGGATGLQRDATILQNPRRPSQRAPAKPRSRSAKPPVIAQEIAPKALPTKQAPKDSATNFFQKYRRKWWFWVAAVYLVGLVPIFGYGYFLYRETSSKTTPVRERIRTIASWAIVFFPVFAYTSWPLAFVWAKKTGNKVFLLLGGIQVLAAIGMGVIQGVTPTVIDSAGQATTHLPNIYGIPLFAGLIAAIIATTLRPRYEESKS